MLYYLAFYEIGELLLVAGMLNIYFLKGLFWRKY